MVGEGELLDFAAGLLGVPRTELSLATARQSIPQWDSIMHLRLAMEAATRFGVPIPLEGIVAVRTLGDLLRQVNGGPVRKVLAVDLDNTLWEGVVGEDGPDGIAPRTDFQREIAALKERGILLVALSKNNPADVEPVWSDPRMTLKRDDFVAMAIDWGSKADNLVRIAAELNLGTDAFVFVDDNPAQRAEMKARHPEVAVPDFPPDLSSLFPLRELTDEDRVKTEQYKAEAARRTFAAGLSRDEFLKGLGIRAEIHPMTADEVVRVAQLSQKANQFTATVRRLDAGAVESFRTDSRHLVLTLHACDRFGDQGLVAFAHAVADGTQAEIADFVMSCRVMDRGLEDRLAAALERELAERGVAVLRARYVPSGRNEPVRGLYPRLGFAESTANEYVKGLRLSP